MSESLQTTATTKDGDGEESRPWLRERRALTHPVNVQELVSDPEAVEGLLGLHLPRVGEDVLILLQAGQKGAELLVRLEKVLHAVAHVRHEGDVVDLVAKRLQTCSDIKEPATQTERQMESVSISQFSECAV